MMSWLDKMAFHMHLEVPHFRLTQRSTSGAVVQKDVVRGLKKRVEVSSRNRMFEEGSMSTAHDHESPDPCIDLDLSEENQTSSEPSLYAIGSKASVAAWNSVRYPVLKAVTESHAMPESRSALSVLKPVLISDTYTPYCYYCDQCLAKLHLHSNIFCVHVPEQWKVNTYLLSL